MVKKIKYRKRQVQDYKQKVKKVLAEYTDNSVDQEEASISIVINSKLYNKIQSVKIEHCDYLQAYLLTIVSGVIPVIQNDGGLYQFTIFHKGKVLYHYSAQVLDGLTEKKTFLSYTTPIRL